MLYYTDPSSQMSSPPEKTAVGGILPGKFESMNLSRDNLSRKVGRISICMYIYIYIYICIRICVYTCIYIIILLSFSLSLYTYIYIYTYIYYSRLNSGSCCCPALGAPEDLCRGATRLRRAPDSAYVCIYIYIYIYICLVISLSLSLSICIYMFFVSAARLIASRFRRRGGARPTTATMLPRL